MRLCAYVCVHMCVCVSVDVPCILSYKGEDCASWKKMMFDKHMQTHADKQTSGVRSPSSSFTTMEHHSSSEIGLRHLRLVR